MLSLVGDCGVTGSSGQCGQQESCDLIGFWQSRGGQTSVSHSTRPLWQVHCVQASMFQVSPSTKYSPPGARHTDESLSTGLWELGSSGHVGQHCPGRIVGLSQAGTGQEMRAHISRPLWQ